MCLKSSPTDTKLKPKRDLQMQIKTVFFFKQGALQQQQQQHQ